VNLASSVFCRGVRSATVSSPSVIPENAFELAKDPVGTDLLILGAFAVHGAEVAQLGRGGDVEVELPHF
jgi:hypothetical protein